MFYALDCHQIHRLLYLRMIYIKESLNEKEPSQKQLFSFVAKQASSVLTYY